MHHRFLTFVRDIKDAGRLLTHFIYFSSRGWAFKDWIVWNWRANSPSLRAAWISLWHWWCNNTVAPPFPPFERGIKWWRLWGTPSGMGLSHNGQTVSDISHLVLHEARHSMQKSRCLKWTGRHSSRKNDIWPAFHILANIIGVPMTSREHGRPKPLLWHAKNCINFSEAILLLLD